MLDKGEVGFVISLLCGAEICDEQLSIDVALHYVEKAAENDYGERCKALLATLYHQFACSDTKGSLNYRNFMMKSLGTFEKILQYGNCSSWVVGEYYNLLFNLKYFEKIINHFITLVKRDINPKARDFFEGGIYTVVDYHNRSTVEEAIQVAPEFIVPSIMYVCYKAMTATIQFVRQYELDKGQMETISKFNQRLMKRLQLWLSDKERLFPEYIDEYAHIILGLGSRQLDDIENYKNEFFAAEDFNVPLRRKGMTFAYIEPVTVRIHHRVKSHRYNPYNRSRTRQRKKLVVPDLNFRFRQFLVHEYTHY